MSREKKHSLQFTLTVYGIKFHPVFLLPRPPRRQDRQQTLLNAPLTHTPSNEETLSTTIHAHRSKPPLQHPPLPPATTSQPRQTGQHKMPPNQSPEQVYVVPLTTRVSHIFCTTSSISKLNQGPSIICENCQPAHNWAYYLNQGRFFSTQTSICGFLPG
jgi:hypothetical protein